MTPDGAPGMTSEAFEEAVRRLYADISVMTLATCAGGAPWAADVYFAPMTTGQGKPVEPGAFELVFFSSPRSRHCRNLAENPACAATIHAQAPRVKDIRGLQIEGEARRIAGAAATAGALAAYLHKFPFVRELFANPVLAAKKLGGAAPYLFSPARIRYVDNAYGFASRFAVSLRDGAPVWPPILESSDRDAPGAEDVADP